MKELKVSVRISLKLTTLRIVAILCGSKWIGKLGRDLSGDKTLIKWRE